MEQDIGRTNTLKLIEIVKDLHWMVRRYADGRMSYATSLFNDHTSTLLAMGIQLQSEASGALYAMDGMGRSYDNLDDAQARLARISAADTKLAECFFHYQARQELLLPDWLRKAYDEWMVARGYKSEDTGSDPE